MIYQFVHLIMSSGFFSISAVDNLWTPIPPKFDPELESHVDMMVSPRQSAHLRDFLDWSAIPYEVIIEMINY